MCACACKTLNPKSSLPLCKPLAFAPPLPSSCPQLAHPHSTLLSTRQAASAFNQPLGFDTSSVVDMNGMFYVRSSPCPAPNLQSSPLPCTLRASRSPAALPPSWATPRSAPHMPSLRLGRPQTPCPTPTSCSSVASSLHGGVRDWAESAATTRSTPARNLRAAEPTRT